MIRAILAAKIPVSFPEHTMLSWGVRKEPSLKMAWRPWNPERELGAFPTRISGRRSDASDRPLMF